MKEILESDSVRSTSTKNSFYKRIVTYLKKDFLLEIKKENFYKIISPEAKKEVDFIVNNFFNEKGKLVLSDKEQYEFWKKEYNLDKSILESYRPKGKYSELTFIIIPELIENLNFNIKLENLIDKREKWVEDRELLPLILGLSDNFNGFSNFLGVVVKDLQNKREGIEEIYEAQKTTFPLLENQKEKVLESLNFLSEKAKLLGHPSLPLLNGWHEYRTFLVERLKVGLKIIKKEKLNLIIKLMILKKDLLKLKNILEISILLEMPLRKKKIF